MKTIFTIMLLTIPLMVGTAAAYDNTVFGGAYYLATDGVTEGPLFGGGIGHRLAGPLWSYAYAKVGQYGTLAFEVAWYPLNQSFGDSTYWSLGLIAGPNADWINYDGDDPIVYMNTAAGLIGTFDISATAGLFGFGKYKFKFVDDTQYQNGWMAGGGFYLRL